MIRHDRVSPAESAAPVLTRPPASASGPRGSPHPSRRHPPRPASPPRRAPSRSARTPPASPRGGCAKATYSSTSVLGGQHGERDRMRRQGPEHAVHRGQRRVGHLPAGLPGVTQHLDLQRQPARLRRAQRGLQLGQQPRGLRRPAGQRAPQRGRMPGAALPDGGVGRVRARPARSRAPGRSAARPMPRWCRRG